MSWSLWTIFGFVLLAGEMILPGSFFLLFFGVSALAVAIVVGLGVGLEYWHQWVLFGVLSLVALLTLRKKVQLLLTNSKVSEAVDSLEGKSVKVLVEMQRGAEGQVELRGVAWKAKNVGTVAIAVGEEAFVDRTNGIVLEVCAKGSARAS